MTRKKLNHSELLKKIEAGEQPDIDFSHTGKNTIIIWGLLLIFVFFGIGGTWITFAKISGAVIAPGEIRVDTERKTVQHLEGGIIRRILVRDGDEVEQGQPLILLDSSKINPTIDQLHLQIMSARLRIARFEAQKLLADEVEWPENDGTVPSESYRELRDSARKVFHSDREALANNVDLLTQQKALLASQDSSFRGRLRAEEDVVKSLQVELDAKMPLFEQDYIDKTEILRIQRAIAERRGQIAALKGNRAELNEKRGQLDIQIQAAIDKYRQDAVTSQEQWQQQKFDLEQKLLPLLDAGRRLTITAPITGEVVELKVHSAGGVVRSGEPLLDIVPRDSRLVVVCNIQVQDIAKVHIGQQADVQLTAFNQRTTPKIAGKVVYISADRILHNSVQGQVSAYTVHIELDREQLKKEGLTLSAGMPAAAFIQTRQRTVLDYLLEPVLVNFNKALRES